MTDPEPFVEDLKEESRLRPLALDEFVGQPAIREQLRIFLEAAKRRGEAMDHVPSTVPPDWAKPRSPRSSRTSWASRSRRLGPGDRAAR